MAVTTAGLVLMIAKLHGGAGTVIDATNGYFGVGDSSTAFSAGQTDLQASSNKYRQVLDSAPGVSSNVVTYVCTVGTANANYAWNEWGIFNNSSAGTMLSRKVQSIGTKPSSQTWVATMTFTWAVA